MSTRNSPLRRLFRTRGWDLIRVSVIAGSLAVIIAAYATAAIG